MSNDEFWRENRAIDVALEAAKKATNDFIAKNGESFCCGFAWVIVRPTNSSIAKVKSIS